MANFSFVDGAIRRAFGGAKGFSRAAVLWIALWQMSFSRQGGTAFGQIFHLDASAPDPAMREKVPAALAKIEESPADISAVETLLAVEPRIVETVGTSETFSSSDPVLNRALRWSQSLQPADVLANCLEKGSNAAVYWALKQIVGRSCNGGFDKKALSRLMHGIKMALIKPPDATRAQAVRTMLVCLPIKDKPAFLKGLLKGQPDQVVAAAVDGFANDLRKSDPDVELTVAKWLNASDDPLLLRASCTYWWLVKGWSTPDLNDAEIAAFERVAGHPDGIVRSHVALAVEDVATPSQPRLIGILLRLTNDEDGVGKTVMESAPYAMPIPLR